MNTPNIPTPTSGSSEAELDATKGIALPPPQLTPTISISLDLEPIDEDANPEGLIKYLSEMVDQRIKDRNEEDVIKIEGSEYDVFGLDGDLTMVKVILDHAEHEPVLPGTVCISARLTGLDGDSMGGDSWVSAYDIGNENARLERFGTKLEKRFNYIANVTVRAYNRYFI